MQWPGQANQNFVGSMWQCIEINELLDLARQSQKGRVHDVGKISGQRLHIIARFCGHIGGQPILCCCKSIISRPIENDNWKMMGAHQSYSAVSMRSSILLLTSSKMRFSAIFLLFRKSSVALSFNGPPAEEERARIKSCSSSWQAISKCSRLIRIWTIWPRYCDDNLSTSERQTFSVNNSSSDCLAC